LKKFILALGAIVALGLAPSALAGEAIVVVEDPTPTGAFSGSYTVDCNGHKHKNCRDGYQDGHVAVYRDGVVACNGSTDYAPYDQNGDGTNDPLQGYVWVGPNYAATGDRNASTPEDLAGVGSNHGKLSGEPTGESPCPEEDPEGDGAGR
jgi:hypothetical protein